MTPDDVVKGQPMVLLFLASFVFNEEELLAEPQSSVTQRWVCMWAF
jgi:hypothetical protein